MTIADVIERLGGIVEESKATGSTAGYFAALYRTVTIRVRDGIAAGEFDDGPRMEELDVVFARRYLDAYDAYGAGGRVTEAWRLAFDTTDRWWPIVLQHLLLGMNAHINLDLGIAAARVAPGDRLSGLRGDFDRINGILGELVDGVQEELASIWPALKLLDHTAARTDEAIVNFAMERARDHAWSVACRLAPLPVAEQDDHIARLDRGVTLIGRAVRHPGLWLGAVLKIVRLGEIGSVRRKIEVLEAQGGSEPG